MPEQPSTMLLQPQQQMLQQQSQQQLQFTEQQHVPNQDVVEVFVPPAGLDLPPDMEVVSQRIRRSRT